jgi:hypothetical protein
MIYVGIDDTDTEDTPGTNQLARALVDAVRDDYRPLLILRHQLFFDPRVPYTSKNGSASILLEARGAVSTGTLIDRLRERMLAWFKPGSDPGLCVTAQVPAPVCAFGGRCQRELIRQQEARDLATRLGIHLEGLGGTQDGVIGALAAVGLAATQNDGRVVQLGEWPDDLSGPQELGTIRARGIDILPALGDREVQFGRIDVGNHLRPNRRGGRVVLFVQPKEEPTEAAWEAVRLT